MLHLISSNCMVRWGWSGSSITVRLWMRWVYLHIRRQQGSLRLRQRRRMVWQIGSRWIRFPLKRLLVNELIECLRYRELPRLRWCSTFMSTILSVSFVFLVICDGVWVIVWDGEMILVLHRDIWYYLDSQSMRFGNDLSERGYNTYLLEMRSLLRH